jgi:hypothetical protein
MTAQGTAIWKIAAAALAVCIAMVAVQAVVSGSMPLTRHTLQYVLLFLVVPSAVVLATSRMGLLQARPWSLLLAGPVAFLCAVTATMVTYNILFASAPNQ